MRILMLFIISFFLISARQTTSSSFVLKIKTQNRQFVKDSTCKINGRYRGTYTNQYGQSGKHSYIFGKYNFLVGAETLTEKPGVTGSFENNCDSIYMKLFNPANNSYYFFAGAISNDLETIKGVYTNLTTPTEQGPFKLNKQDF